MKRLFTKDMGGSRLGELLVGAREWCRDVAELAKARLMAMVLVTTLVGFYVGSSRPSEGGKAWHLLVGTALVAAAAAGLNQLLERDVDRRMSRTCDRPIAAGRFAPRQACLIAVFEGLAGLFYLAKTVGMGPSWVAALTLFLYVVLYTPLKRKSPWHTLIGAVSGALPPLIGYVAGDQRDWAMGWVLFGILFLWQLPHFWAIAWLYRQEYGEAGIRTFFDSDRSGVSCGWACLVFSVLLWAVSLVPWWMGTVGGLYGPGAVVLGGFFVGLAFRFLQEPSRTHARSLFLGSIVYLPALLALLVVGYRGV
ncbi:heme o synthase [Candidatus Methylacidithermus pantelleriae]|uniref:Protoheme IX farnesyltransferase n=1 Tax=Candidatus Methylacidithermus pantelleriae TaxID=2744239 RepID=A0A8J2BH18_9BACT|nr:heme o synthase [Candidatus Methylacidithermus pantelleriae]CAF0689012.1 Protoheme IX farnesyltransferase [Candidatus Methylacidithermus pantelleriae]